VDLQLIIRVLWRFRIIVGCGVVLAIGLATFSYAQLSLSSPHFKYRQAEEWESLSTLFVTSSGFPWGEIGADPPPVEGDKPLTAKDIGPDPAHLVSLAALYVQLATSDPVLKLMRRDGPIEGQLQAFPVASGQNGDGQELPMVTMSAISDTPAKAKKLAARHAEAFVRYLEREQETARIPAGERVVVDVVRQPQKPTLLEARKKTRPVVVFVAVMIAVFGLAFALENLRPRVRVLPGQDSLDAVAPEPARRSA
jgi:hypothetical protein